MFYLILIRQQTINSSDLSHDAAVSQVTHDPVTAVAAVTSVAVVTFDLAVATTPGPRQGEPADCPRWH